MENSLVVFADFLILRPRMSFLKEGFSLFQSLLLRLRTTPSLVKEGSVSNASFIKTYLPVIADKIKGKLAV